MRCDRRDQALFRPAWEERDHISHRGQLTGAEFCNRRKYRKRIQCWAAFQAPHIRGEQMRVTIEKYEDDSTTKRSVRQAEDPRIWKRALISGWGC